MTRLLAAANCRLGKTSKKKVVKFTKKKKKNRVSSQSIKAGTTQPAGTAVPISLYAKKK